MEEFEKFIFFQFERFGYEMKVQIMDGQFLFKHKDKEDYWIVSDGLWAMEHQYELFQILKEGHKNEFPRADKNTSILLLINLESDKIAEDDERFVQIENDPLYFKKYVLTYTARAFSTLMQKINSMEVRALEDVVMNNHIFVDLTCNEEYAKLLYTIVHKLPFIPIHTENVKDYDNQLSFSTAIAPLYGSLENFPEKENGIDSFIENLINDYEDEED